MDMFASDRSESEWDSDAVRSAYNSQRIPDDKYRRNGGRYHPYRGRGSRSLKFPRPKFASIEAGGTKNMKRMVNLMKRLLFQRHIVVPRSRVLDLCGGKGQDLYKYAQLGVDQVVLIDQSERQLDEARSRYALLKTSTRLANRNMRVHFLQKDLVEPTPIRIEPKVEVLSCHLALHYLWGSSKSRGAFMETTEQSLKPGGVLLLTIVDADKLPVRGLRDHPCLSYSAPQCRHRENNLWVYQFSFPGVVKEVEEAVIPRDGLLDLCLENGLVLVDEFDYGGVANEIRSFDADLSPSESDIYGVQMYKCYAFRMVKHLSSTTEDDRRCLSRYRVHQRVANQVSQWFSITSDERPIHLNTHRIRGDGAAQITWVILDFLGPI